MILIFNIVTIELEDNWSRARSY